MYEVAKSKESQQVTIVNQSNGLNNHEANSSVANSIAWRIPATWHMQKDSANRMQHSLYQAKNGVTIAISVFPGDVGGVLPNVNRWRRQLGLTPMDSNMQNIVRSFKSPRLLKGDIKWLAIEGAGQSKNQKFLIAIVSLQDKSSNKIKETWFFKMSGTKTQVDDEQKTFFNFLQTIALPRQS